MRLRSKYRKKSGDNFKLACEALGKPEPQITWYRNGQEVAQSSPPEGVGGGGGGGGRAMLSIQRVEVVDTGLYTCKASNTAGQTTRNFTLDVIPGRSRMAVQPAADPDYGSSSGSSALLNQQQPALSMSGNTTVDQGSQAVLQCRVRSSSKSEIMWLKQLEHPSELATNPAKNVIEVGSEKFKILGQSSPTSKAEQNILISASEDPDGEYVNKLLIQTATPTDTGTYYCFVKNKMGYKFKEVYLSVIPSEFLILRRDLCASTTLRIRIIDQGRLF